MARNAKTMRALGWTHLREEEPRAEVVCLVSNGRTVEMAYWPEKHDVGERDWSVRRWYDENATFFRFDHSLWHRELGQGYYWKWWKYCNYDTERV